jgi:predicted TIM-barrel fold metal-dependent hydrolase
VPALCAAFRAFNRWLDDDWGFAYRNRIFGAPYITLADPEWAIQELQWAIGRGVRVIVMRTAPVPTSTGGTRSPGDPAHDPFWAAAADAGVVVAFHSGDAGYGKYIDDWEPTGDFKAFQFSPMRGLMSDRAPYDMFAVLVCHGVFSRHGGLRVAAIESGSEWVAPLMKKLKKAYAQNPHAFGADPFQQLRDHLWVAPFYEDDIRGLTDCIGVEHVLFGSDYPHAEGLAEPLAFVDDLDGFSDAEVRQVMSSNALSLLNG